MYSGKVKYFELRPAEFRKRLASKALAYLPLGTLEWHGEHLPLGADAIQSEALMIEAAKRFGGIVLPPIFLGPDRRTETADQKYLVGMDTAMSTQPHQQLTGSAYWVSQPYFVSLIESILSQLKRAGFKMVFADGHGPSRKTWCSNLRRWEEKFGMNLYGITESLRSRWPYMTDHAARNETSITAFVQPELVDVSVFTQQEKSPLLGVNGEHPYLASAEEGKRLFEEALVMVGELVNRINESTTHLNPG